MPRPSKGPRLYLCPHKGRPPIYVIRDLHLKFSTGFGEEDRDKAEKVLEEYLQIRGATQRPVKIEPSRASFVYFVTAEAEDFPIKIGISTTADERFRAIQTALPYDIKVLGMFEVAAPIYEKFLHGKFRHLRLKGEWSKRDQSIFDEIERLRDSFAPDTA